MILRQELGDGLGFVLKIGIHNYGYIAAHMVQRRRERHLVAKVPGERDHQYPRVPGGLPLEDREALIYAAVVHEDDLVRGPGKAVEHRPKPLRAGGANPEPRCRPELRATRWAPAWLAFEPPAP